MAKDRRPTAKDVARRAGVSQPTVSYVLNDAPNQTISAATRERVLKAAEELQYAPSAAARSLRTGRSSLVLAVLPDRPLRATMSAIIEQLSDLLAPHGYTVIFRRRGESLERVSKELAPAIVVNLMAVDSAAQDRIAAAGIPVVGDPLDSDTVGFFGLPEVAVGELQASHLIERGHTRLGYAAPADARLDDFFAKRVEGVRRACAASGIALPRVIEVPQDIDAAIDAIEQWRTGHPHVTGVCAYNDETAFTLLAAMRALHLTAPDDLAVIGVDNHPLSPFANPPLTTIDKHIDDIARSLAGAVMNRLGKEPPEPPAPVPTEVVIRESA